MLNDSIIYLLLNEPVVQLMFYRLEEPVTSIYDSVYKGRVNPTKSKYMR